MKIPQRVALQSPIKQLRVEYVQPSWRIWLTANGDFTLGTFLNLGYNGKVERVTWHEDGTESVFEVTDAED
jgi:hypothetical protein